MSIFKGSMVAIATPMNEDGSLDFESLEKLIEFHVDNLTDVIISVGTTGESATLDFNEHSKSIVVFITLECSLKSNVADSPVVPTEIITSVKLST